MTTTTTRRWTLDETDLLVFDGTHYVAQVYYYDKGDFGNARPTAIADARLIAAAPAMFNALRTLMFNNEIVELLRSTDPMALAQARAAIAAAEKGALK